MCARVKIYLHPHSSSTYRIYLKWMDRLSEWVSSTKQRKPSHHYSPLTLSVRSAAPKTCWIQSFAFLSMATLTKKKTLVYTTPCTNEQTLHQRFFTLFKLFAIVRNLCKCVTVFDQKCPFVRWFRCRTFLAYVYVVNCHFINKNNSIFIKLRTYVVNVVSCYVKYYIW